MEHYHLIVMLLTMLILSAFLYVYVLGLERSRQTLFWILSLICMEANSWIAYRSHPVGGLALSSGYSWLDVLGFLSQIAAETLILITLSPLFFHVRGRAIYYAVPFGAVQMVYALIFLHIESHPPVIILGIGYVLIAGAAFLALIWSLQAGALPIGLAVPISTIFAIVCMLLYSAGQYSNTLFGCEAGAMMMAALLIFFSFRRISPGTLLASVGIVAWGGDPLFSRILLSAKNIVPIDIVRVFTEGKVILALGLLLLLLEDALKRNKDVRRRERRVRREMESLARLNLSFMRSEDMDRYYPVVCHEVAQHSHFQRVALIFRQRNGQFTSCGKTGFDEQSEKAIDSFAKWLSGMDAASADKAFADLGEPIADTVAVRMDFRQWMPQANRLKGTQSGKEIYALPLSGGSGGALEGMFLLSGKHPARDPLTPDDVMPLETFAGRLQAKRAQVVMMEKLIEAEKMAGVGQLADKIALELNNPLTVILGYSSLLRDSAINATERKGAEAILEESRRMRGILDNMVRVASSAPEHFALLPVSELLEGIERLHRLDFLRNSIEFHAEIASSLPQVRGNVQQLRQALLYAVQYAVESVRGLSASERRSVSLRVSHEGDAVCIRVSHTGRSFLNPATALDPFSATAESGSIGGLGLSLCAAILNEHQGEARAVNEEPSGAAVILMLPAA